MEIKIGKIEIKVFLASFKDEEGVRHIPVLGLHFHSLQSFFFVFATVCVSFAIQE
jgi:hypothetical protein